MATTTIVVQHGRAADFKGDSTMTGRGVLSRVQNFLSAISSGNAPVTSLTVTRANATGTVTLASVGGGVAATGTLTYSTSSGTTTATVNGVAFAQSSGSDAARATALKNAINASTNAAILGVVTATDNGSGVCTVTAATKGTAGNASTLVVSGTGLARSGATLAGGVDCMSVTVGGVQVKLGPEGVSDTATATAMAAAINADTTASKLVTATSSAEVVTLAADAGGDAGNMALSSTATSGTATASGATLTGGTQTTYTFGV